MFCFILFYRYFISSLVYFLVVGRNETVLSLGSFLIYFHGIGTGCQRLKQSSRLDEDDK